MSVLWGCAPEDVSPAEAGQRNDLQVSQVQQACEDDDDDDENNQWTRFGANDSNSHSNKPRSRSRFTSFLPQWATAPQASITGQPVSDGRNVYVGDYASTVTARSLSTGAIVWQRTLPGGLPPFQPARVQSTLLVADGAVYATEYFSTTLTKMNAATGAIIWTRTLATSPFHRATGSPAYAKWRGRKLIIHGLDADENLAYLRDATGAIVNDSNGKPLPAVTDVPTLPGQRSYTVTGRVVAVDATTGQIAWNIGVNASPSEFGIGVWSTAAIDERRGRLYIGTGQSYNPPASPNACAILGIDLSDGAIRQVMSFVPPNAPAAESCVWGAAYPNGVGSPAANADLPGTSGDVDVGSAPVLYTVRNRHVRRDLVAAMNKAGRIRAFDRATGQLVWERQISTTGGSVFGNPGVAVSDGVIYASVLNDFTSPARNTLDLSNGNRIDEIFGPFIFGSYFGNTTTLVALDGATGATLWSQPNLVGHVLGAPTVSEGVVYQAAYNGQLRAFNAATGAPLGTTTSPVIQLGPGFFLNAPFANSVSVVKGKVLAGAGQQFGPTDGTLSVYETR
ncbi:MAG: PQQ-binding-like beta-propeller repeat protein [Myxococcaceae bacterium]|nr:PQQ-binding-like beta-propeller repeat protein [Myxococcaceae bacterium]